MLLKKPATLFASSNAFTTITSCHSSTSFCSSSANNAVPSQPIDKLHTSSRSHRRRTTPRRSYATVHDIPQPSAEPHYHHWPQSKHPDKPPTPYQIFNQAKHEPYSKHRFYELVKIYHPDRNTKLGSDNARETVLERYRMVIAANAILSDPERRAAYDQFGWGWEHYGRDSEGMSRGSGRFRYTTMHRWRKGGAGGETAEQDPMFNATWEDWERWYAAHAEAFRRANRTADDTATDKRGWPPNFFGRGGPGGSRPMYMNNYAFFSLLLVVAALGGVGNATRANEGAKSRLERVQFVNDETSRALMRAREDSLARYQDGERKPERIRRLIREREGYDEGEFDGRALKEGDEGYCGSESVKDRDEPRFWEKPPEQ